MGGWINTVNEFSISHTVYIEGFLMTITGQEWELGVMIKSLTDMPTRHAATVQK